MNELSRWCKKNKINIKNNFNFGIEHGYCCKGIVRYFIEVDSTDRLSFLLTFMNKKKIPFIAVGGGSNILFKTDFKGALIFYKNSKINIIEQSDSDMTIQVGASVSKKEICDFCVKNNLSGLEYWSGIPGLVGGGVAMNAGAYGKDVSSVIQKIELVSSNNVNIFNKNDFEWNYRGVKLPVNSVITSVFFKLCKKTESISNEINKYSTDRKNKHPLKFPSCGSVFKNPSCTSGQEGLKAWELIQNTGLAGFSVGGARVSLIHTNFIINQGGAKSSDFIKLFETIQQKVFNKFSVKLETEVRII